MSKVFVYGTLKEGFANFHVNAGRRVPGAFATVQRLPLFIVGDARVPWLLNQPGVGEHVRGQLFEVDEPTLQAMDVLEQVDEAGWYRRERIQVRALDDAEPSGAPAVRAFVYFGAPERLQTGAVHAGPLAEFTAAHDRLYRP